MLNINTGDRLLDRTIMIIDSVSLFPVVFLMFSLKIVIIYPDSCPNMYDLSFFQGTQKETS